ncbi:MAG: menaquinone biosynthesis protein [Proteobacteria bacterium]|nr:menaquinone biosynthesis protein [Pseudomonadota bacterium]MBU1714107.1 menaquinone biosynthesis protein [Pseudomonadota bacterium]
MGPGASVDKVKARIGMVNFINTAPLYEVWRRTVHRPDWLVTEAPPSVLNGLLYEEKLDLGFISSHEYAVHSARYKILSDLSISATGPVGSVILFSRFPVAELAGKRVLLTSQSQTSVSLIKIIMEEFHGIHPDYAAASLREAWAKLDEADAVLAIGDEALRLGEQDSFPFQLDLAEIWYEQTGLPFVFAVWAVREKFCCQDPDSVVEIHQELLRCLAEGAQDLRSISTLVAPRIPMKAQSCYEYLKKVEYDLGERKQAGLKLFFDYLIKRGEAEAQALPLKICN